MNGIPPGPGSRGGAGWAPCCGPTGGNKMWIWANNAALQNIYCIVMYNESLQAYHHSNDVSVLIFQELQGLLFQSKSIHPQCQCNGFQSQGSIKISFPRTVFHKMSIIASRHQEAAPQNIYFWLFPSYHSCSGAASARCQQSDSELLFNLNFFQRSSRNYDI